MISLDSLINPSIILRKPKFSPLMNPLAQGLLMLIDMNYQQAFIRVIVAAPSGCVISTQTKVPAYRQPLNVAWYRAGRCDYKSF
jgi:hypothetical protein